MNRLTACLAVMLAVMVWLGFAAIGALNPAAAQAPAASPLQSIPSDAGPTQAAPTQAPAPVAGPATPPSPAAEAQPGTPPATAPRTEPPATDPLRTNGAAAPRAAAPPIQAEPAPPLPAADAARLAELLRDETRRDQLLATLDALAQVAPDSESPLAFGPQTLGAQVLVAVSGMLGEVADGVVAAVRGASDIPALAEAVQRFAFDPAVRGRFLDVLWKIAVVLGCGIAVERLLARALRPARHRIATSGDFAATLGARVRLSLSRLALDLIPVIAFAAVSYAIITAIERWPSQRVLLLVANNAYLAARLARAFGRAVFAPEVAGLRLLPMSNETAAYCQVWFQRLSVWIVTGYAIAEATLIFGLGSAAHDAMLDVLGLVVVLALVLIVLQNRVAVAAVIRAPDEMRGPWAVARNRLADIWHVLAIVYLFAGWLVSALDIADGYGLILRFTATTIAVIGAAKLVEVASDRLLDRLFRVEKELAGRNPGLEERVNRYTPALRKLLHAALWVAALIVLLQTWGFGSFAWFETGRLGARVMGAVLSILFTLVVALLIWEMANAAITRHLAFVSRDAEIARTARVRTLLPMLRTTLLIVMVVVVGLIILNEIGVNIAPLLAGAGVVGIAIGFGSQTLVRDVITGIFLLAEDAIAVGDVVNVGGQGGVVEALSIRSIRLRSLDGAVHIVPFSAVTTVTNMTKDFAFSVFDIGVAYSEDTDKVVDVLRALAGEMREEPRWANVIREPLEVLGVDKFLDSAVVIRCRFRTNPGSQWAVSREFNRRYKRRFDEVGIEIPFPYRKVVMQQVPGEAVMSPEAREAASIAGAS